MAFVWNKINFFCCILQVTAVREVVPGKSNNEVILVLQFYDYNVEKTIQAYLEGKYL